MAGRKTNKRGISEIPVEIAAHIEIEILQEKPQLLELLSYI